MGREADVNVGRVRKFPLKVREGDIREEPPRGEDDVRERAEAGRRDAEMASP